MRALAGVESRWVDVNGRNIHYYTCGEGEPLVIVHGGGEGASAWMSNIAVLSRKYTLFVPDLPGFGLSSTALKSYHIPKMADFIDNFTKAVGLRKFHLMGHSFGGGVAAHYALKYPQKIHKLVLVSSLCMGKEIAWWIRLSSTPFICNSLGKAAVSLFKGIKKVVRYFGPWEVIEPVTKTSILLAGCICTLTQQTISLLNQLPQIMVPTLVMWGTNDPIVPFKQAYAAGDLIPNCQVKVFEGCGHSVYRDRLREFSKVLMGFLG